MCFDSFPLSVALLLNSFLITSLSFSQHGDMSAFIFVRLHSSFYYFCFSHETHICPPFMSIMLHCARSLYDLSNTQLSLLNRLTCLTCLVMAGSYIFRFLLYLVSISAFRNNRENIFPHLKKLCG